MSAVIRSLRLFQGERKGEKCAGIERIQCAEEFLGEGGNIGLENVKPEARKKRLHILFLFFPFRF